MQTDLPSPGAHPAIVEGADNERSAARPVLSAADRRSLRAAAHHLDPVVMIGDAGLTPSVLAETERALAHHQLIKIRVLGDDRENRIRLMEAICASLGCASVQMIGKLLVVWRPAPETPSKPDRSLTKKQAARAIEQADAPRRRPLTAPRPSRATGAAAQPAKPSATKARASKPLAEGRSTRAASGTASPGRKFTPLQKPGRPAGTSTSRPKAGAPTRGRIGSRGDGSSETRSVSGSGRGKPSAGRGAAGSARGEAGRSAPRPPRPGDAPRRASARPTSGARAPAARKRRAHS